MAESVVSSVGQTIGKLLVNEAKFLRGVEGKVKDLHGELRLVQDLLRDLDARRMYSEVLRIWVWQLRDFAYDAEDVIEQYILRVVPKKGQNIIKAYACFRAKCTCARAHVVGIKIDGLRSSIFNLRTSMQKYGIRPLNEGEHKHRGASTPKWTYTHFGDEDFVGREDNIKVLVKELLKDGEQHRVISIYGMDGLGKTTLAKKVFAHDQVKNHFNSFAWVCLSQEYHVRDILEGILAKLIPDQREKVRYMGYDELLKTLHMIQKQKRCIVVLDDIWTKQAWDSLQAAFPIKNMESKLLITTHNEEVAEYINPHGLIHELQGLSDLESLDLLKKVANLEMEEIDETKKSLIVKHLKKCGGFPLAINVLGKLLQVNEWETVLKKADFYLSDYSDVPKWLALSYEELPWHLKPCFLYLGSFPEDAEILAMEVLQMWIAEGIVSLGACDEEREIQVEVVAEQYLMELVNRGMVQVRFNSSGKIKTLHLHNLMRNLCLSEASRESFLSILDNHHDNEIEDHQTRRLSLNMGMSVEGNLFSIIKPIERTMLRLRTFMFFGYVEGKYEQFQPIFIICKFLRVLKLEGLSWMRGNMPESMGDLVHLRFLSLERSEFEQLPQSMGNLVFMEFLDLRVASDVVVTVPNVLWKMRRLRHLHLPYHFVVKEKFYGHRKKLRLDTLKNLWTLRNFGSKNCDVNDVGKLTNLRKLTISKQHGFYELEIIPQLAKFNLKHLQTSSFRFSSPSFTEGEMCKMSSFPHFCKLFIRGNIEKLPKDMNLPQKLRKLVLVYSYLEEDPMPTLEKLHHLVVLLLGNWAFVGKELVCSREGFPQLKHLVLDGLPDLEEWRIAKEAMPQLSRLGISGCLKLKALPEGVLTYDSYEYMVDKYWKSSHKRRVNRETNS